MFRNTPTKHFPTAGASTISNIMVPDFYYGYRIILASTKVDRMRRGVLGGPGVATTGVVMRVAGVLIAVRVPISPLATSPGRPSTVVS